MKTIAQQLNVKEFPFRIKDKDGNEIYFESSSGFWNKREYDKDGNEIYYENSSGFIEDKRVTEMTIAEIEKELNITNLKIKK